MAYLFRHIDEQSVNVAMRYDPDHPLNNESADSSRAIYGQILERYFSSILYWVQRNAVQFRTRFPHRPWWRIVNADTTTESFRNDVLNSTEENHLLLDPNRELLTGRYLSGENYVVNDNGRHVRLSENGRLRYDFKVAVRMRTSMSGMFLSSDPHDPPAEPHQEHYFVSERFRFEANARSSKGIRAGVLMPENDALDGEIIRNRTPVTSPFLARQMIGPIIRSPLTPRPVCTGGRGMQRTNGFFSLLQTSNAFVIGGTLSDIPYSLFNFIIGRRVLETRDENTAEGLIPVMMPFSNGVNGFSREWQFLPLRSSTSNSTEAMAAEELVLRTVAPWHRDDRGRALRTIDGTNRPPVFDYLLPDIFLTDEFIQSNYREYQGSFMRLETMQMVSPSPNDEAEFDLSGARVLCCALEAFPTRNRILMFRGSL